MKIEYETFTEIAQDFISGEKIAHLCSDHNRQACAIWQNSIQEFALALDDGGFKPNGNYNKFWDLMGSRFKRWEKFSKSNIKEIVRTKRALRVEITQEQCLELFGEERPKGYQIYTPYVPMIVNTLDVPVSDDEHEVYYVVI